MGTTETALPSVVCDAGPVIHLDELGFLDQVDFVTPVVAPEAQPSSACTGRGWSHERADSQDTRRTFSPSMLLKSRGLCVTSGKP